VRAGGITAYNGDGGDGANGNVIRNNIIHDIKQNGPIKPALFGILVAGYDGQVYNNVLYNIPFFAGTQTAAIDLYYGPNHQVYNNTIYNVEVIGIQIRASPGYEGNAQIRNNIVYQNARAAISDYGPSTQLSNNLTDGTNPNFVNAGAANFRLQPGSRAIDTGTGLSIVTTDLTGGRRPEGAGFDIGAYEYRPAQPASAPPAPSGLHIVAN
jgi:Right handed beta helix region